MDSKLLCPYRVYKGKSFLTFTTKHKLKYKCFFFLYNNYSIAELEVKSKVYSFSFVCENQENKSIKFDPCIGLTIGKILNEFFIKNPDAIIQYICENSDLKAFKRQKSFAQWTQKHNEDAEKVLIQAEIQDVIYLGVLLLKLHPERKKIKSFLQKNVTQYQSTQKIASLNEY